MGSVIYDKSMSLDGFMAGANVRLCKGIYVEPAEIALVRNATEALDTVLLGYKLTAGDEIACSKHDYYAMLDALEQRRLRDGIVLRIIEPPIPAPSLDAITELVPAPGG